MTTTRRLGCIGTLVAALALAGCGSNTTQKTQTYIPIDDAPVTAKLPEDCESVVTFHFDAHGYYHKGQGWLVTYKTNTGDYKTRCYGNIGFSVDWKMSQKQQAEEPLDEKVR